MSFFCSKFAHKFVCMNKLSIITINRNNAVGLRKTMESVFSQTNRDFEYIVVDGASTDESVDIIRTSALQAEGLDFKWISEPDTGIYNAMNKGIEIASGLRFVNALNRSELVEDKNKEIEIALGKRVVDTFNRSTLFGDKNKEINRSERSEEKNKGSKSTNNEDGYVLMLNSGDYFVDEQVVECIMPELDGTDIIQGNLLIQRNGTEIKDSGIGKSNISFVEVMGGNFSHQASFCKIDLFDKYGYFDESYRINGDTVFYAKCLGFGNASFRYVDINIAHFDTTGISADPEGKWAVLRKEEDERYAQMFSKRMWDLYSKESKKVRLYDRLHAHHWSWALTMAIAHVVNWLYKNS